MFIFFFQKKKKKKQFFVDGKQSIEMQYFYDNITMQSGDDERIINYECPYDLFAKFE